MSQHIKLGLLGNNLGRSRAQNLHELLGELYGLKVTYTAMDLIERTKPVSIEDELVRCHDLGFGGVNVTHPYKQKAFDVVTTMQHFPKGLTSVNTVILGDNSMLADNTDYSGCCRSFRSQFGAQFEPGRVFMLGAGGVGVAIAYALMKISVKELIIFDTNVDLAKCLVNQMRDGKITARLAEPDLIHEMEQADGLVNATPVGMFQYPGSPFPIDGIENQSWAFDAVYTPENTEFLNQCRKKKIKTLSGFHLFLYQGLDAFKHFTGITADAAAVEPAFLKRFPLE